MKKENEIIAEFMGAVDTPDEMKYHTSWHWLMPVANEIIKSRDEQNSDWDLTELKYALCTTNIDWVYNAVINFINKYNK